MKYLVVEDFSGQPVCFLFPRRVDHGDMRDQLPYGRVVAAGYVEYAQDGLHCYGGCAELALRARPEEDAALIAEAMRPRQGAQGGQGGQGTPTGSTS